MKNLTKLLLFQSSFWGRTKRGLQNLQSGKEMLDSASMTGKEARMTKSAKFVLTMSLLTLLFFAFSAEKAAAQQDCTDAGGECKFLCFPSNAITSAECTHKFLKNVCCIPDNPPPPNSIPDWSVQEGGVCLEVVDCVWPGLECHGLNSAFGGTCQRPVSAPTPTSTPQPPPTTRPAVQVTNLTECYNKCSSDFSYDEYEESLCFDRCDAQYGTRPAPTSPPSTANCGNLTCSSSQTCIISGGDYYCLTKGTGGIGSFCGSPLSGGANNDACSSGYCDPATYRCANPSQPPAALRWRQIASCPAPITTKPSCASNPDGRNTVCKRTSCSNYPPHCQDASNICSCSTSIFPNACIGTCADITVPAPTTPPIPTSADCPSGTPYRCIDPLTRKSQCVNAPCPSTPVAPTKPQPPVSTPPPAAPIPTSPVSTATGLCEGIDDDKQFQCYSGGCPQKTGSICAPPNTSGYPACRDRSQFCHITFLPTPTPIPSSQCRENVDCPVCLGGNSCQPKPGQTTAGPASCECRAIPVISSTPGPTSPPAPGSVLAALSLTLEPIGRNREDLDSSVRLQPVTIELFDSTKSQLQLTTPANSINQVEYDPDDGKFKRTINLGSNLAAGDYIVKVKVGNYLKRKYTRILTVKASEQTQTFNVEKLTLPAGNTNNDTTIDTADYGLIVSCFGAKQNAASCADKKSADIDFNKRVDGIDFNTVLRNIGKSDE